MSKALYRKYRSRSFDEVVGQEHITKTLKNALQKGAISHAYLFTGPRGVGKTSIARILAHAINDLAYSDESTHLDIIEIDAASNRKIDEIRELRSKVHIAPTSAKYKVYIIDEVHMLTREAFNALLKTLEEPPEHAVFILATTEAHKVPDTIVSRTQRFTFRPISRESTVSHLKTIIAQENLMIDDEALQLLAEHGRGSFRDSISMLDQLAGIESSGGVTAADVRMLLGVPSQETITKIISALTESDTQSLFDAVSELKEQGIHSGRAAMSLSEHVRNQLLTKDSTVDQRSVINLLKNLLPLCTTASDYIGLELALLDYMTPANSVPVVPKTDTAIRSPSDQSRQLNPKPLPETKEAVVKTANKETAKSSVAKNNDIWQEPIKTEEIKSELPKTLKPAIKTQPFKNDIWQELLNDLKKKHNTLYGVLRMSEPSEIDGQIRLDFKFGFHKKQVDLPKNSAIVRDYLMTYFGISSFTTHLTTKQKNSPKNLSTPSEVTSQKSDVISSVSDIFGGAELLE